MRCFDKDTVSLTLREVSDIKIEGDRRKLINF